jgi:DNA polymerase-1
MNSLFDSETMDRPLEEKYPWMRMKKFVCVKDIETLDEIVEKSKQSGRCVIDLETSGLDVRVVRGKPKSFIAGFCLSYDGVTGFYVPVNHGMEDEGKFIRSETWNLDLEDVRPRIQEILDTCVTIYHNAGYDHAILENWNFNVRQTAEKITLPFPTGQKIDAPSVPWHDTFILSKLKDCSSHGHGLKELSKNLLGMEMIEIKDLFPDGSAIKFYLLDPNRKDTLYYGCSDAICTWHVFERLKSVEQQQPIIYWMERRTVRVVREMAKNRILVNKELIQQKCSFLKNVLKKTEEAANELIGEPINLSSQKVVAKILTENYHLPLQGVDEDGNEVIHTDEKTLSKFKDRCDLIPLILKQRDIVKTMGTYAEKLLINMDEDNTVKFDFRQLGTETGRFSCSGGAPELGYAGVNIQAMTKPAKKKKIKGMTDEQIMDIYGSGYFLRSCFMAREGYKIAAIDYSGEELRVAANVSQEPIWIKSFNEGDGDLHTETARLVFNTKTVEPEQRDLSKILNFQTLYGGGPSAIAGAVGCSREEAKAYQQKMMGGLKNLQKWIDKVKKDVKKNQYCETPFGRRRSVERFLKDMDNRMEVAKAERLATNTPIQGSGGDIMKLAMIKTQEYADQNNGEVRILITVHDELVFEILESKLDVHLPNLMNIMSLSSVLQTTLKWQVPLSMDCEVGDSWDIDYEFFEKNPEHLLKLNPSLRKMKARQFGMDIDTLKPIQKDTPQDSPQEKGNPEIKEAVTEVTVDDLAAPLVSAEQESVLKAYDVFKIASESGICGEDALKQAIETYLKLSPPKVYTQKGIQSLNSDELLSELSKIPLSWKPYSYTLNRVITKRDLILLNMILEESADGNNEAVILKPDGVPLVRKKLDAIRFDILARHYKL